MQGINKRFLANVPTFLRATPLRVQARAEEPSVFEHLAWQNNPPVFDFDMRNYSVGVELIPFTAHAKTHFFGTQRRIRAYWLDYTGGRARICNLNRDADYLFTPMLTGCYIGIRNGRICHIAGDIVANTGGAAAQRARATALLGAATTIGFESTLANAPELTLVGVCTAGNWAWYVQGHATFDDRHGALQPVFNHGAHAGQTVVQLTDLTYG